MAVNEDVVAEFASSAGPTFNTFSLEEEAVSTMSLRAIGLDEDEWISLIEVRLSQSKTPVLEAFYDRGPPQNILRLLT